jgi:hypothetical protein
LENDLPDITGSLAHALSISPHTLHTEMQIWHHTKTTHINQRSGEILALLGELPELLQQSMGNVGGRLDDGRSAGSEGRVDFGSLVENVLEYGLSLVEPRSDSLSVSGF